MPDSINIDKLTQYTDRFAGKILEEAYASKSTLGGADLLKLTPVRQVNLGILNRLFEQWKSNALSFRSAYFNFENEEVRDALESFMNITSRHIAVKRLDLEPLLRQSVKDAVILLYTPAQYFETKIKSLSDGYFTTEKAVELVKYTHIHQGFAKALESRLTESGSGAVSSVRALDWLVGLGNDLSLIDKKDDFEQQFAAVSSLEQAGLFTAAAAEPVVTNGAKKAEPKSFFDTALSEIENTKPAGNYPKSASSASVNTGTPAELESLNSRFKVDVPKPTSDKSYGSVQVRVENIAGSIPLGQRFMFVNQLFSRNSEHFDKAIYELDNVKSYAEAEDLIWHRYASKHAWDLNGEAVSALLAIVKRKFEVN
jgi:hypothetical protein